MKSESRYIRPFRSAATLLTDRNFYRYLWATVKETRNMYYRYKV